MFNKQTRMKKTFSILFYVTTYVEVQVKDREKKLHT